MRKTNANLEMIKVAARHLEPLLSELVFVGGATLSLYVDEGAVEEARPTDDVDCIVEVASRVQYSALEAKLRQLGLNNVAEKGAPICRWGIGDLIVDVMPTDEKILGFSNRWYLGGIKNKKPVTLGEQKLAILPLDYLIASKLEAFSNRGKADPRLSKDLEDIVYVLDGNKDPLAEMSALSAELKTYFRGELLSLLASDVFQEALQGFLRSSARLARLKKILEEISL